MIPKTYEDNMKKDFLYLHIIFTIKIYNNCKEKERRMKMKKIITLAMTTVIILSLGVVAFAETNNEVPDWYNEMIKWKKDQVQQSVDNGQVTEEQANYWNERIEYMEKFHKENGFGFQGGCGGFGRGYRRGPGGFGPGMHW